jgi:hypothetical protein
VTRSQFLSLSSTPLTKYKGTAQILFVKFICKDCWEVLLSSRAYHYLIRSNQLFSHLVRVALTSHSLFTQPFASESYSSHFQPRPTRSGLFSRFSHCVWVLMSTLISTSRYVRGNGGIMNHHPKTVLKVTIWGEPPIPVTLFISWLLHDFSPWRYLTLASNDHGIILIVQDGNAGVFLYSSTYFTLTFNYHQDISKI